jgi:predicted permease
MTDQSSKTAVQPVPLLFFLSVVTLIADYKVYDLSGAALFLAVTALLAAAIGWLIGRRWKTYPWQIGILGAIPAAVYLAWRFYVQESVEDSVSNLTLFVFHPLLVLIAGHFGGLVGRWQSLKSRTARNGRP